MMDNVLIRYRGGGYDGCFWEPNFATIIDGEFHDIYSSGRLGCPTWDELKTYMEDVDDETRKYDWYDVYKIPDELDKFVDENITMWVYPIAKKMERLGIGMEARCRDCDDVFPIPQMLPTDYQGMGGIVIGATNLLCEDCYYTPSDEELEEYALEYADDMRDCLIELFPELENIDMPIEKYVNLFWALVREANYAGDGWFQKEGGNYVYYTLEPKQLIDGYLSENMKEFVELFGGQRKRPMDVVLREAGYNMLPGFEEV